MKNTMILLFAILTFSCSNRAAISTNEATSNTLYTIPVTYKNNKISVSGTINDSVPIRMIFDTGGYGLTMHYNLKEELGIKDSIKLSIGGIERMLPERELDFLKNSLLLNAIEETREKGTYNGIVVGWDFFGNQIIELSEQDQCIRILKSTEFLTDYESIDCKLVDGGKKLVIAVPISIQGKVITSNLILDTGFNGMIMISKEKMKDVNFSKSKNATGVHVGASQSQKLDVLTADSVKIGNSYLKNIEISAISSITATETMDGIIGMEFFKNYSVVFDFKDNRLYIKPIASTPNL